jgi:hypothetical protein
VMIAVVAGPRADNLSPAVAVVDGDEVGGHDTTC